MVHGYYKLKEEDVKKFLMAGTHCGDKVVTCEMKCYTIPNLRRPDGHHMINLEKTWNILQLAARIIAGNENPKDVCAVSGSRISDRAVLKFSKYTSSSSITGKYIPGTMTNQSQKDYREPRLIVVTDPGIDGQAIVEAASMGITVIAFCNTNTPLNYIDLAIPCNNKGSYSIGVMWWMLTREVLRYRQVLQRGKSWELMVDMFFHRDQNEEKNLKEIESSVMKMKIDERKKETRSVRRVPIDRRSEQQFASNQQPDQSDN